MSPAKHSYASVTDRQTDGQRTDKVIPMCRYASQATQKSIFIIMVTVKFTNTWTYVSFERVSLAE